MSKQAKQVGKQGPNQSGEMQFRGAKIIKGFVRDTHFDPFKCCCANGWLHIGDIGYYNDEGEWFIVGRLKELIKYHQLKSRDFCFNIHIDKWYNAAVIGIPHDRFRDLPMAFVVKQHISEQELQEQDVIQFVAGTI